MRKALTSRVLVIDDDGGIRELIKQMLEGRGYSVTSASNGATGYDLISKNPFDLVITDIQMNGIDGITLITRIRLLEDRRAVPCLVITGNTSKVNYERAMGAGADMVIGKPFDLGTFIMGVEQLLEESLIRSVHTADLESFPRPAVSCPPSIK